MSLRAATVALVLVLSGCLGGTAPAPERGPQAALEIHPTDAPNRFILDASASRDPDGGPLTYGWNWLWGHARTSEPTHEVELPAAAVLGSAQYPVTVVVRDATGAAAVALAVLKIGDGSNEPPEIHPARAARVVLPGAEVSLDASASFDPEGDPVGFEWLWGPREGFVEHPEPLGAPDEEPDGRPSTFTTGMIGPGGSFEHRFEAAGTYNLHCHPHPWMKGRLTVDPGIPASDAAVVLPIEDFLLPGLTVGAGTVVRFTNTDPVAHTATVEDWIPGTTPGSTEATLRFTPPAGDHVVRLVATDAKGARTTQTWGVRVADGVPAPSTFAAEGGARVVEQELAAAEDVAIEAVAPTRVRATLAWESPNEAGRGNVSLGADSGDDWDERFDCLGRPSADGRTVVVDCVAGIGDHSLRVRADQGAIAQWRLEVALTPYLIPDFGDSSPEHIHP